MSINDEKVVELENLVKSNKDAVTAADYSALGEYYNHAGFENYKKAKAIYGQLIQHPSFNSLDDPTITSIKQGGINGSFDYIGISFLLEIDSKDLTLYSQKRGGCSYNFNRLIKKLQQEIKEAAVYSDLKSLVEASLDASDASLRCNEMALENYSNAAGKGDTEACCEFGLLLHAELNYSFTRPASGGIYFAAAANKNSERGKKLVTQFQMDHCVKELRTQWQILGNNLRQNNTCFTGEAIPLANQLEDLITNFEKKAADITQLERTDLENLKSDSEAIIKKILPLLENNIPIKEQFVLCINSMMNGIVSVLNRITGNNYGFFATKSLPLREMENYAELVNLLEDNAFTPLI